MIEMISKIHEQQEKIVLAACDKELLEKTFEDKKARIEITEDFYGTKETTEEELSEDLEEADIINLVGEKTIALAVKNGLADPDQTLKIDGIPHAQIVKIKR